MEQEEVVYLKISDMARRDVVFEGKVSTDVKPRELIKLRCFRERGVYVFYNKATNKVVESFKGLQNNVELVAGRGRYKDFSGVLYVGVDDGVWRTSESVPSCECVMMSVWYLSHEECEKAFKCETLEELEMSNCELRQIPRDIGKLKKLKNLRLWGLYELESIPEEMGELSSLEVLLLKNCGIEILPKRLKDLKTLRKISLVRIPNLQLNAEDLVVFSKLKHLKVRGCNKVFKPPIRQSFWEMIKSSTDLRVLKLNWMQNQKMVAAALEENGSIVVGGRGSESYAHFFKRNKENHERALQCVVHLLAIRRCRNALNNVPKEMIRMLGMMLLNTRCDVEAWRISDKQALKKARSDE